MSSSAKHTTQTHHTPKTPCSLSNLSIHGFLLNPYCVDYIAVQCKEVFPFTPIYLFALVQTWGVLFCFFKCYLLLSLSFFFFLRERDLFYFLDLFIYLFSERGEQRKREREREFSMCWLAPQMVAMDRAGPASQEPGTSSRSPM